MSEERLKKEQEFHDQRFGGSEDPRKEAGKFYSIALRARDTYQQLVSRYCAGARLLEYGCGTGSGSIQWLEQGALLTGIDISPEGIAVAKNNAEQNSFQAEYFVRDAEATGFESQSFDVVVGTGILHHLDLNRSYAELNRVLAADGRIIFHEPLGHNPFINLYRRLTPSMRTEDEHPLMMDDIVLLKRYFASIDIAYFSLFSLCAVPFRNSRLFPKVLGLFEFVDRMVFQVPVLRKYAWTVVIHAADPITVR